MIRIEKNRKQIGAHVDANLYLRIKARAVLRGRTTGELIDDAIRAYLDRDSSPSHTKGPGESIGRYRPKRDRCSSLE